jgi:hypothetical protein
VGFPTLKKLTEAFKDNDQVMFWAVQTVFEGYNINSRAKLRKNQLKYDVKIPMAHAPGNNETNEIPQIMRDYRSGGTPWAVIIDQEGIVIYNHFHIEADQAVAVIQELLAKDRFKNSEVGPVVVPGGRDYAAASMRPPAHRGRGLRPGGKSEIKRLRTEDRRQRTELRIRKWECGSRKNSRTELRIRKSEK